MTLGDLGHCRGSETQRAYITCHGLVRGQATLHEEGESPGTLLLDPITAVKRYAGMTAHTCNHSMWAEGTGG